MRVCKEGQYLNATFPLLDTKIHVYIFSTTTPRINITIAKKRNEKTKYKINNLLKITLNKSSRKRLTDKKNKIK